MSLPILPPQEVLDWITANLACDPETGEVFALGSDGSVGSDQTTEGYVKVYCGDNRYHKRSNIIWFLVHGKWPELELDHDNRIRTDDRLVNLIPKTTRENSYNRRHCLGRDLPRGVWKHSQANRYCAKIYAYDKQVGLGTYLNPDGAFAARLFAEELVSKGIRFGNSAEFKALYRVAMNSAGV